MTPVFLLSDGYLANGAEPWLIPELRRPAATSRSSIRPTAAANGSGNGDGRLPALQARRTPGPAMGHSRHAGPGAPHRRPGKARRHRQRQLRSGQPRAHDPHAGQEDRQHRQRHSRCWRSTGPRKATCWWSAGAAPTARSSRPCSVPGARGSRSPTPICATSIRCRETPGEVLKRFKKVLVPELNARPTAPAAPGQVPGRRRRLNKVQGKPFLVSEIEQKIERDAEVRVAASSGPARASRYSTIRN